jgi:hypothetical protein
MTGTRQHQTSLAPSRATLWVGWIAFAAILMFIVGGFNIIDGLAAIFKDELFVTTSRGILVFDITAWGWIHLVVGVLQVVVAWFLLRGAVWARMTAVALVALNAIEQLAFLGAYPFWATIIIVLDVVVIWAIVVHGDEARSF